MGPAHALGLAYLLRAYSNLNPDSKVGKKHQCGKNAITVEK